MATTPNYGLPFPSDYSQPADSPAALQALATQTDTQLLAVWNAALYSFADLVPSASLLGPRQISAVAFGPVTLAPGQETSWGPFGVAPGTFCVCGTQHPSTYLLAVYNDLGNGTAEIRVRNATTATTHTNVKVHAIFINLTGA